MSSKGTGFLSRLVGTLVFATVIRLVVAVLGKKGAAVLGQSLFWIVVAVLVLLFVVSRRDGTRLKNSQGSSQAERDPFDLKPPLSESENASARPESGWRFEETGYGEHEHREFLERLRDESNAATHDKDTCQYCQAAATMKRNGQNLTHAETVLVGALFKKLVDDGWDFEAAWHWVVVVHQESFRPGRI